MGALVDFFAHLALPPHLHASCSFKPSQVGHGLEVWRKIGEERTAKGQEGLAAIVTWSRHSIW